MNTKLKLSLIMLLLAAVCIHAQDVTTVDPGDEQVISDSPNSGNMDESGDDSLILPGGDDESTFDPGEVPGDEDSNDMFDQEDYPSDDGDGEEIEDIDTLPYMDTDNDSGVSDDIISETDQDDSNEVSAGSVEKNENSDIAVPGELVTEKSDETADTEYYNSIDDTSDTAVAEMPAEEVRHDLQKAYGRIIYVDRSEIVLKYGKKEYYFKSARDMTPGLEICQMAEIYYYVQDNVLVAEKYVVIKESSCFAEK